VDVRARDEHGFTLIELLVVILVVGILAAIALPAFTSQRARAADAEAKETVRTAYTAIASWNVEHGDYDATVADLVALEPSLDAAHNLAVVPGADSFTVSVESRLAGAGGTYSIARRADGSMLRDCSAPGRGSCRAAADALGNRW
jgi:type IV pilus assembly protein PilA